MLNGRVKELLDYLNVLSQVQGAGHYVNEEIKEVVKELRLELGLEKKKQDTLKASRKLVFEAKLRERQTKKVTFLQQSVFEAVFSSNEKEIEILADKSKQVELEVALIVLEEMKAPVKFELSPYIIQGAIELTVSR